MSHDPSDYTIDVALPDTLERAARLLRITCVELSLQEARVAVLFARGLKSSEIADELGVSPETIYNHTYAIRRKLKLPGSTKLGRYFRSILSGGSSGGGGRRWKQKNKIVRFPVR